MENTMDSATSGFSWGDFFNGAGGLIDKYAQYRLIKATDAKAADGQPQQMTIAGQTMPTWLAPAVVVGGLALVVFLVVRK